MMSALKAVLDIGLKLFPAGRVLDAGLGTFSLVEAPFLNPRGSWGPSYFSAPNSSLTFYRRCDQRCQAD